MTKYLVSPENPDGRRLEDILRDIRADILERCSRVVDHERPEAEHVMANNMRILPLLTDAIRLAEESTEILARSFGPAQAAHGEPPAQG